MFLYEHHKPAFPAKFKYFVFNITPITILLKKQLRNFRYITFRYTIKTLRQVYQSTELNLMNE